MYDIAIVETINSKQYTNALLCKFPFAKVFEQENTQIETIKKIILWSRTKFVWVLSNNCDYNKLDFTFVPRPDQNKQIHVWINADHLNPYNTWSQLTSYNTWLIPIDDFKKQFQITSIFDYKDINYHYDIEIPPIVNLYNSYDIFFISNKEPFADNNYNAVCGKIPRQVKRVMDINNRTDAIKTAASMSATDWFFCIPSKLNIVDDFPWNINVPSYTDLAHYIFYAKNPVNDLVYGHMALILYSKKLVLDTNDVGIDFTMSKNHKVIPILSGISNFNLDSLVAYRTAFRELVKLLYFQSKNYDSETQDRIDTWLTKGHGLNANWVLQGAKDAANFYKSVNGDYKEILNTYHWQWVDNYAKQKGYDLWK